MKDCQPGTPWAFEVIRHESQWMFEPTGTEIFKCYTVTVGSKHLPCTFKGAITQFETASDLAAGVARILAQNRRLHDPNALQSNVIRAETTLEHYILYELPSFRILVIVPVTEDSATLQRRLEAFGPSEVVL